MNDTKEKKEEMAIMQEMAAKSAPTAGREVHLTKREKQVLDLISQGHSSREAAERLVVSKRTVDFHLANIYDKLQVTNRVQAFRAAMRLGLFN
jgi:ATP/maltotriose-dependent transcriptional regulator MalT